MTEAASVAGRWAGRARRAGGVAGEQALRGRARGTQAGAGWRGRRAARARGRQAHRALALGRGRRAAAGTGARGARGTGLAGRQAPGLGPGRAAWARLLATGCALGALGLFSIRFYSVLFLSRFLDIIREPSS